MKTSLVPLARHRQAEKQESAIGTLVQSKDQCGFPPALTMHSENGQSKRQAVNKPSEIRKCPEQTQVGCQVLGAVYKEWEVGPILVLESQTTTQFLRDFRQGTSVSLSI